MSPTSESIAYLKSQGYLVSIVEKWNPHAKIRQDLFGFIDLLAIKHGETLAVQTTTASNFAARKTKILSHENLPIVSASGWQIRLHGWKKTKAGWTVRDEQIN